MDRCVRTLQGYRDRNSDYVSLSLVSENHKLREICIEQMLKDNHMMKLGRLSDQKNVSEYNNQETIQNYRSISLRCIVVYSTHLAEQKKATLARQLQKEQAQLEKAADNENEQEYSCATEAQKAWNMFQHQHRKSPFLIVCRIESHTRPKRRHTCGIRNKIEMPEMVTIYTLHVDITPVPSEVIEEQEQRMGYFVLVTNHRDTAELPAEQVLREYK